MHDIVFTDGRAAERSQDADGKYGNRDGSRNREPGAQSDVHANRAKEQAKQRSQDHRAHGEFHQAFFRGDIGAKLASRRRGTPWPIANRLLFAH